MQSITLGYIRVSNITSRTGEPPSVLSELESRAWISLSFKPLASSSILGSCTLGPVSDATACRNSLRVTQKRTNLSSQFCRLLLRLVISLAVV